LQSIAVLGEADELEGFANGAAGENVAKVRHRLLEESPQVFSGFGPELDMASDHRLCFGRFALEDPELSDKL
jgi:hypothetical protein